MATEKNSVKKTAKRKNSKNLSREELLFCVNYLKTYNAESAARHAGFEKSECLAKGYEMLQSERVQEYIKKMKENQNNYSFADGSEVLQKYMDIAFGDIFDLVTLASIPIELNDIEATNSGIFIKSNDKVHVFLPDIVSGSLIAEIRQGKDGITIKFSDRMKALEWLTAYHEMNPADVHRREAERRKISIAAAKLCPQGEDFESTSDDITDDKCFNAGADNFQAALEGAGQNVWADECDEPDEFDDDSEF